MNLYAATVPEYRKLASNIETLASDEPTHEPTGKFQFLAFVQAESSDAAWDQLHKYAQDQSWLTSWAMECYAVTQITL